MTRLRRPLAAPSRFLSPTRAEAEATEAAETASVAAEMVLAAVRNHATAGTHLREMSTPQDPQGMAACDNAGSSSDDFSGGGSGGMTEGLGGGGTASGHDATETFASRRARLFLARTVSSPAVVQHSPVGLGQAGGSADGDGFQTTEGGAAVIVGVELAHDSLSADGHSVLALDGESSSGQAVNGSVHPDDRQAGLAPTTFLRERPMVWQALAQANEAAKRARVVDL